VRVVKLAAQALMISGSLSCSSQLFAQQAAPASTQAAASAQGTKIAVIDVGMIVKNHPTIKLQQQQIREQVKVAQEELNKRRQAIVTEAEQLKMLNEGSPDFNKLQEKLTQQEAQLKLDSVRREKDLEDLEAKMALEFYTNLQTLIAQLADYYQIDLVLRANNEAPDLKQPATIQMALEKGVVFSRPQLDMTNAVLEMLKKQAPTAPAPTPGATPGPGARSATNPPLTR
jgi:Skp family chaperone for outer membrane proteins